MPRAILRVDAWDLSVDTILVGAGSAAESYGLTQLPDGSWALVAGAGKKTPVAVFDVAADLTLTDHGGASVTEAPSF